jgi:hypothetical protein
LFAWRGLTIRTGVMSVNSIDDWSGEDLHWSWLVVNVSADACNTEVRGWFYHSCRRDIWRIDIWSFTIWSFLWGRVCLFMREFVKASAFVWDCESLSFRESLRAWGGCELLLQLVTILCCIALRNRVPLMFFVTVCRRRSSSSYGTIFFSSRSGAAAVLCDRVLLVLHVASPRYRLLPYCRYFIFVML